MEVDVTERRSWYEGGARTVHATSQSVTIPAFGTVVVPIVVPIAPAWSNTLVMLPTDATLAASFAGFVIASRDFRIQ